MPPKKAPKKKAAKPAAIFAAPPKKKAAAKKAPAKKKKAAAKKAPAVAAAKPIAKPIAKPAPNFFAHPPGGGAIPVFKPAPAKPAAVVWHTPAHPNINDVDIVAHAPLPTPGAGAVLPTPPQNKTLGQGVFGKVKFLKTPGGSKYADKMWLNSPDSIGNRGERICAKLFAVKKPLYLLNVVRTPSGVRLAFFPGITIDKWMKDMNTSKRMPSPTFLGTMINSYLACMLEASQYRLAVNDQHTNNMLVDPQTGVVKPIDYGLWELVGSKGAAFNHNAIVAQRSVGWICMTAYLSLHDKFGV